MSELCELRRSAKLTQAQLAELAGVSRDRIVAFERGQRPSLRSARLVVQALRKVLTVNVQVWDVWPQHFRRPAGIAQVPAGEDPGGVEG